MAAGVHIATAHAQQSFHTAVVNPFLPGPVHSAHIRQAAHTCSSSQHRHSSRQQSVIPFFTRSSSFTHIAQPARVAFTIPGFFTHTVVIPFYRSVHSRINARAGAPFIPSLYRGVVIPFLTPGTVHSSNRNKKQVPIGQQTRNAAAHRS